MPCYCKRRVYFKTERWVHCTDTSGAHCTPTFISSDMYCHACMRSVDAIHSCNLWYVWIEPWINPWGSGILVTFCWWHVNAILGSPWQWHSIIVPSWFCTWVHARRQEMLPLCLTQSMIAGPWHCLSRDTEMQPVWISWETPCVTDFKFNL